MNKIRAHSLAPIAQEALSKRSVSWRNITLDGVVNATSKIQINACRLTDYTVVNDYR